MRIFDEAVAALEHAAAGLVQPGLTAGATEARLAEARDIVSGLRSTLRHAAPCALVTSLDSLYAFCLDRIEEAGAIRDARPLAAASFVMGEIRATWRRSLAGQSAAPGRDTVGAGHDPDPATHTA